MTPPQFLSSLQSRGVQLIPDASTASGVRVVAPRGVVTGTVLERIRTALPTLLPLIEDRARETGDRETPSAESAPLARAREDLPRETDPEAFAAWLEYARAVPLARSFDEWAANREFVELAALGEVVESNLAAAEEATHAAAWRDALDFLESLPVVLEWRREHLTVPDVAEWLRKAGERRNKYRALYGPAWPTASRVGRSWPRICASFADGCYSMRRL